MSISLVILVLISPLSTFPLTNVTEQKLVNDPNVESISLNLSPLVSNNNNISLHNNADVNSTAGSSIQITTGWPSYSSTLGSSSNELSGGEIALIVLGVLFFLCCCGGGTAYKSGHWESARVWVSD